MASIEPLAVEIFACAAPGTYQVQGTCVAVLGIQIDSIAMEARLPPEKLCRATLDAAAALNAASLTLRQTESLTGLLAFCSRVVRLGRTRLQSLYTFQAAFPRGRSARRRIPYELYACNAASLALAQDAHAHINTNEVDAILQGFLLFSHHWLHHTLVIHTDSSTAHTRLSKGFLHGPPNAPLKSLLILAAARDIQIRNYERHCALQNLSTWPASRQSLTSWLTSRLLGNSSQKAVKPDTALADLAALRAYHVDNFLDDKLFDNKHFRRLIDGARRLTPTTKVRVRKPISREAITKLSAGLATLPLQSSQMTTDLKDDLNFATACRVAFAGFLRIGEFTYKREDLGTPSIFLAAKLTRSDIRFSSSLDHAQLTLKRSKTDRRHEGVQTILAKTGGGACPVDALQKLLLLDPKGPQFRKGAAQHAHDSGILDDQIQMLGRWTSEAFRVYFTTNASVLYKLNHQFQTGSPAPLSLLVPPPSPPPS
ncbi:hypothetical protein EDB81DRAFT_848578 [Dactylonectria macrodidyma]|uniref:Reverse transcriptase RNase H-like domain-containing protein n=1 Tax=Dactylonectria macrodidyma TaxID=307937 RepID=A0A9P9D8P5_9HYPO|nr:hypothetical protein EDB81DRAFT_848578 [Dactylonectria macrodidyma]